MNDEIQVSVLCNAYNHEKYIRDALEGFVMQKTDFKFEVLVHDDASTDRTADIIREYEKKYPEIIKPIYETENQWSKHDGSLSKIQYGRVQGKYIAMCEGDDYWTDPLKLQKQYDAMESHPEVDICSHAAMVIDAKTNTKIRRFAPSKKNCILSAESIIRNGGGYVATVSLFYRTSLNQEIPTFRKMFSIDYTLQIHGSLRGGMLFLNDSMSVYRFKSQGSWTERTRDLKFRNNHYFLERQMLQQLDHDTKHKYSRVIQDRVILNEINLLLYDKEWKVIFNKLIHFKEFQGITVTRWVKIFCAAIYGALCSFFSELI